MVVEWKKLLSENNVPQQCWPVKVEEVDTEESQKRFGHFIPGSVTVVTYGPEQPVAVLDSGTGKNRWNPEIRRGLELIYNAYRHAWGELCRPAWSRRGNFVRFYPA